jgi:hypothetical protein
MIQGKEPCGIWLLICCIVRAGAALWIANPARFLFCLAVWTHLYLSGHVTSLHSGCCYHECEYLRFSKAH